jgi:hypothetical protein
MRNLLSLFLLIILAAPALAQSGQVDLDRFSMNLSPDLNAFQSPQFIYGNVEISFSQKVTMVEVAVKMRDGTGKAIGGNAVTKSWASANAGDNLEFDYHYYNPSAVQQFQPVLVVTAKGADGSHIHQVFDKTTSE